jgi:ABC-type uncharacterized transport system auxiliary subunit
MRAWLAALFLAMLLPGCGGLQREAKPTVWLSLEPTVPAGGVRLGAPTLEVETFATAPSFRTDQVPAREASSRWTFATYHRWVSDPGDMIASAARDYLSRCGLFGAVFTPPAPVQADLRLSGAVRALYWDRERRAAVLEVELSLIAAPDALRGFWIHRKEVPVPGDGAQGFLAAASSALELVLADLRRDLAGAIAGAPPKGD